MAPEARWLKPIVRCWSGKLRVGCVGYETNAEPAARGMGSPHGCGTATTGAMRDGCAGQMPQHTMPAALRGKHGDRSIAKT